MKLPEHRFVEQEINGERSRAHSNEREKNEAKVGRSRQTDVFGLDRGAGGETAGPEGRWLSMMSLPNRVFMSIYIGF